MTKVQHTVTIEEEGQRLDQLVSSLTGVSRSQVQNAIKNKKIKLNKGPVKKNGVRVSEGDRIEGSILMPDHSIVAEDIPLEIIHEEEDFIVINKDPGIVVHPDESGHAAGTLLNALVSHTKLSEGSSQERPGIVHRLDKDTSGVMIVAKNNAIHEKLAKAFHDREVDKYYLALVIGRMKTNTGRIEAPLRRSTKNRTQMAIHSQGKPAVTLFEVMEVFENCSLLKIKIETGRTHQIRVHMASIGHPIIGDSVYGDQKFNAEFQNKYGLTRQFLHSKELHILGKAYIGGLKKDLVEVLEQLRS